MHGNGSQRRAVAQGGAFTINIVYSGVVPATYQALFDSAKTAWMTLIPAYLPGIAAGTLTITASFPYIDGAGSILGQVCFYPSVDQFFLTPPFSVGWTQCFPLRDRDRREALSASHGGRHAI